MSVDEEKWLNVIGRDAESTNTNSNTVTMMIRLKCITSEDIPEQKIKLIPKKTKKNTYFVKDQNTTLTDEDIHYQILNIADIIDKKPLLPELLKKDVKITENFDKLLRHPERSLSSKLISYFTRNLKHKGIGAEDFVICYEDIQKDVKRIREARKSRKYCDTRFNNQYYKSLSSSTRAKRHTDLTLMTIEPLSTTKNNCDIFENKLKNNKQKNNSNNKSSILKKIDLDFKPTILLSTKTYSRRVKID